jgi:PLD-like domain
MRCHSEKTWIQAIDRLASSSSTCRIAVAYCGSKGYNFLPNKPADRPEDLRIVVDASDLAVRWGLTNPKGVKHLIGLPAQVRSCEGLHAKVYIFDDRAALVGSANMSESSITRQLQMGVELWNARAVNQLINWFDKTIWLRAIPVDLKTLHRLSKLKPAHPPHLPGSPSGTKLPIWKWDLPDPSPDPSDFKLAITATQLRKLLQNFRKNICPYGRGETCFEHAKIVEAKYRRLAKEFRSLWNRRSSWRKTDLARVFDLAYTNGRAAVIKRSSFVRQSAKKIRRSLEYLLEGPGDPFIRFEKVVDKNGQYKLNGLSTVGAICLMHFWKPSEFALVAKPVGRAIRALVDFGRPVSLRTGQGFKDRTEAAKKITRATRLQSLGRVDHFLDAIAKRHIGNLGKGNIV